MGTLILGLIGAGYLEEVALVAVCDIRQDALRQIGRQYPVMALTKKVSDLLDDPVIKEVAQ